MIADGGLLSNASGLLTGPDDPGHDLNQLSFLRCPMVLLANNSILMRNAKHFGLWRLCGRDMVRVTDELCGNTSLAPLFKTICTGDTD